MTDDANHEQLWRQRAEVSPHVPDDEIERLFIITAAKDNEDFIRQITEWVFQ